MKIKAFICFLFFLPFIIVSFCNHPTLDDYWNANTIAEFGRLGAAVHLYNTVSGRFFSNLMMSICNTLPANNVLLFKLAPVIFLLMLGCSFYYLLISIFKKEAAKKQLIIAAVVFVALHLVNMRSLYEGLYWTSAVFVYQLTLIIFVCGIASIFTYLHTKKIIYCIAAIGCSFVLAGTAESIVPVYLVLLLLIAVKQYHQKKQFLFLLSCIIALLIGTAIVLLSPGNYKRIAYDTTFYQQDVLFAITRSLSTIGYYVLVWGINLVSIGTILLMLPYCLKYTQRLLKFFPLVLQKFNPFIVAVIAFVLCASLYAPLYYFETGIPFPRVTAMVFVIALLFFILLLCIFIDRYAWLAKQIIKLTGIKNYTLWSWLLLSIGLFTSRNFLETSRDVLNGSAFTYNKESLERYNLIRTNKNDTCYVTPYSKWPASFLPTMEENTGSENFMHMDKYFGKTLLLKKK
ncbi:hypothetical protein BH11BAC6_BH11BAC6_02460 [soil metagenome]